MADSPQVGRPVSFDRAAKDRFLEHLRAGSLIYETCRLMGIHRTTFTRHFNADKKFAEEVTDARSEATEAIEKVMYQAAKAGEPWAVNKWLDANDRQKYGKQPDKLEITGKVVHELDTSQKLDEIINMRKALAERAEVIEAVELERVDDDDSA